MISEINDIHLEDVNDKDTRLLTTMKCRVLKLRGRVVQSATPVGNTPVKLLYEVKLVFMNA